MLQLSEIMYSVSLYYEQGNAMDRWDFLLTNFGIPTENVWLRGPYESHNYKGIYTQLFNADLINQQNLEVVVLQPKHGLNVQGITSLVDFVHPENALYLFGADHVHMEEEEYAGLTPSHHVYIPLDTRHDMYVTHAASIVFYDRMIKNG